MSGNVRGVGSGWVVVRIMAADRFVCKTCRLMIPSLCVSVESSARRDRNLKL